MGGAAKRTRWQFQLIGRSCAEVARATAQSTKAPPGLPSVHETSAPLSQEPDRGYAIFRSAGRATRPPTGQVLVNPPEQPTLPESSAPMGKGNKVRKKEVKKPKQDKKTVKK